MPTSICGAHSFPPSTGQAPEGECLSLAYLVREPRPWMRLAPLTTTRSVYQRLARLGVARGYFACVYRTSLLDHLKSVTRGWRMYNNSCPRQIHPKGGNFTRIGEPHRQCSGRRPHESRSDTGVSCPRHQCLVGSYQRSPGST